MQTWEADSKVSGLYRRVGSTKSVWAVKARIKGGKPVTVTLGSTELIKAVDARKLALEKLSLIAQGLNPNELDRDVRERKRLAAENEAARGLTLRTALSEYLSLKERKPATIKSYQQTIERNFQDWLDKPIRTITREDVLKRFQAIKSRVVSGKRSSSIQFVNPPGEGEAQRAFRYLGAVCNSFGNDVVGGAPLLAANPVDVLKDKKVRRLLKPRTRYLTQSQRRDLVDIASRCAHPEWTGATKPEDADYVLLMLMTGLRGEELCTLQWANVNFRDLTLKAVDTKNHNEHVLPLTGSIGKVLSRRKKSNKSPYVFPSPLNDQKPASMSRVFDRVCSDMGSVFTSHDLRRTFATVASEMGLDVTKIGAALNHAKKGVTGRYIQSTTTMMAETLQAVQDALFETWEVEEGLHRGETGVDVDRDLDGAL